MREIGYTLKTAVHAYLIILYLTCNATLAVLDIVITIYSPAIWQSVLNYLMGKIITLTRIVRDTVTFDKKFILLKNYIFLGR